MENATFNISFFCRNARLSLQKAAFSRRSHMLSEELEHLRSFESVVLETLPQHPLYSAKRGEKEILELEFYLPDVRKRLAELEGKHPFLYKHHHKGGSSNSRSKRMKESHETIKVAKKKACSSPQASSIPPSSSSSSSRKFLPAPNSEHSRRALPVPGKGSSSVHHSRSPSVRSTSTGSLRFQKPKCSPVGATDRSALDPFVDEAVSPSEELKLPSGSVGCRDVDLRSPSQNYEDDFRFLPANSKLFSGNSKCRSGIDKYGKDAGFSSHKSKFPTSDDVRCRYSLENYGDGLGFPSPKTPMKPSIDDYSDWIAHGSDTGDYTGETLMEGFVVHSDRSDGAEDILGCSYLYKELGRQRSEKLTSEFCSQRAYDSMGNFLQKDETSLPDLISETVHGMRASSSPSRKRKSLPLKSNGKGNQRKDAVDAMWSSFQELVSVLDDHDYKKTHSSSVSKNAGELSKSKRETERSLAGLTLTENLEEALKRLGSLQESDESFEEPDSLNDEETTLLRPFSLETPSKLQATKSMATGAEDLSFAGASSRRSLFGKDVTAEAQHGNFDDLTWSENDRKEGDFDYREADSKTLSQKCGRGCLAREERGDCTENAFEGLSTWKSRTMQPKDDIVADDALEVDNVYKSGKEKYKKRNKHKLGSLKLKADQKKKVKFEKKWTTGTELEDSLETSTMLVDEHTPAEAGGRSLNSRHSSSGTGDAVSRLERFQMKHFVGKENPAQPSDGEDVEGVLDSKPIFSMSHLSPLSHDAFSSSFSSSASCGAVPSCHYSENFRNSNFSGRLSPFWSSPVNNTFEPLPDEADAQLYDYQRGSSRPQQLTYCNPVFDFDSTLSSKAYSESISRPMFDPCDADEERLKSILGDCSYVAGQLDTLGEPGNGSIGLHDDIGADHASLADMPNDSNTPPPIVKSNLRDKLRYKHVSGHPLEDSDKLQAGELVKKMDDFQRMLDELKQTVQSCSVQVEEQVDLCQDKVKVLERQLDAVKIETSSELLKMKSLVKSKIDMKMEKGGGMKDITPDGFLEEKLQKGTDECTRKSDSLQMHVDSWLSRMQVELRTHVEEVVVSSMEKLEISLKTDLEKLELQRLRDLGNLKKEMGLKLSLHESKEQLNKKPEKQLDLLVEDVLEKQFSHIMEVLFSEKRKEFTELHNELSLLKKENEAHCKGRAEVQEHMETMTRHLEEVKRKLDKDQEDLRFFKDSVKKQSRSSRNEGMQVRFLYDNVKKEKDAEVDDLRLSIDKLKAEATECKEKILGLRNVEKFLSEEQADLRKTVEMIQKSRHEDFSDLELLKRLKTDFEKGRDSEIAEREGAMIMERMESLSQLYLGGLGEVRAELKDLKLHFQVKFDEIELSTKASLLSSLEARILELEKEHTCTQALENKAEDILAIVGKHRKLASAAATDAAASAHKAEESLAELLGFISSEMNNTKKKGSKLQESLVSDRETSSSLLLEMMTISADFQKEKEAALVAASVAKKHIEDVATCFEGELAKVRADQSKVEKDRDFLNSLAEEMAGIAAKGKNVLHELMEVRQKNEELSGNVLAELAQTKSKSTELAEEVVAEMLNMKKKSMGLSEDIVAEMSNTKRKTLKFAQEVLGEITNTRTEGLQVQEAAAKEMAALQTKAEEALAEMARAKRKSLQIQEDVAAEAASWASKAEVLVADIIMASNKTAQCKEAAIKEAAALANKAEDILEEMEGLRRKSTQLHEHTTDAVKSSLQLVQEQCNIAALGWKETVEGELKKMKSFFVENEQMKTNIHNPLNTENLVMKRDFAEHVAKTDSMLKELQHSVLGRVETIASMLEAMFRLNAKPGEAKLQDLLSEWQQLAGRCSLSELEQRFVSLEASQLELSKKTLEVQSKAEELEMSVADWLPKYDAAARVLNEVESRLAVLETSARNDLKSEKRLSELDEKEPFPSFYKDLGSGRNMDEGRWSGLEAERNSHNLDTREKSSVVKLLDARIVVLESRIEHVASATYTNLRILDTKVEHINGSLETTLESATMAEKKCNLLGAELVKVFRMLANSGKPSPEKSLSASRSVESSFQHHFLKPDASANKKKEPQARLNLKKHGLQERSKSFIHGSTKGSEQNGNSASGTQDKGKAKTKAENFGNSSNRNIS